MAGSFDALAQMKLQFIAKIDGIREALNLPDPHYLPEWKTQVIVYDKSVHVDDLLRIQFQEYVATYMEKTMPEIVESSKRISSICCNVQFNNFYSGQEKRFNSHSFLITVEIGRKPE